MHGFSSQAPTETSNVEMPDFALRTLQKRTEKKEEMSLKSTFRLKNEYPKQLPGSKKNHLGHYEQQETANSFWG